MNRFRSLLFVILCAAATVAQSQPFHLPTENRALFQPGGEERFLVGTVGKPYTSGRFGCVRTNGRQMHEGLDVRCLKRDKRGEPVDAVLATAKGVVAYINARAGLSNYGKYIVLRHSVEGIQVYSLYAHLSAIQPKLRVGTAVNAQEPIGVMGRTANTPQGISKDRAHLHFEIDLLVNERFAAWHKKKFPGQRNDHGAWNGLNLLGLDPRLLLLAQQSQGTTFSLLHFIRNQPELCRVLVRSSNFSWAKRHAPLTRRNPIADREGAAAYEVTLNYNGVPFRLVPRAPSEVKPGPKYQLLGVNEAEQRSNPCRNLVVHKGGRWQLASAGINLLDLLTY